jgi:uncharacterized protein YqeY
VKEEDSVTSLKERLQGDVVKHMKSGEKVALQTVRNAPEKTSGRPVDSGCGSSS